MQEYKLALLGFGNVHRNFAQLLLDKDAYLQSKYNTKLTVVGIITNSKGYAIDPNGLDLAKCLELVAHGNDLRTLHTGANIDSTQEFIELVPADVVLEATWLDPQTGQPAIDYCKAALQAGKHLVTANKGPVAFAYETLRDLAAQQDLGFFFESTVMDGSPVHAIGREAMLGLEITGIRAILNSTTNYMLTRMGEDVSFEQALKEMQTAGLAEANPSNDVDGWDSSIKILVLANIYMDAGLSIHDVDRTGIRDITAEMCQQAVQNNERIKLVCEAIRDGNEIKLKVSPQTLPLTDSLSSANRTAAIVSLETDVLPEVTLLQGDSSPRTTAYGMLVDTLNILRGRR